MSAPETTRRLKIDFTVTDDEGNEVAWGGTSYADNLKTLADELQAIVEREEFPHAELCFSPGQADA